MTKRISNEEIFEALIDELDALSDELAEAIETGDAGSVINIRNELKSWHAKLKELPSLTGLKQGKSLLKEAAKLVSKAALWLQANPEPDPRPAEIESQETPALLLDTTTQADLNLPTLSGQNPIIPTPEPEKTTDPLTPQDETPASQEEKPVPTTAEKRKQKLI